MDDYDLDKAQAHFRARVAFTTGVHELEVLTNQGPGDYAVVDARFPADFARCNVPGAINLPPGRWNPPRGLRKDVPVYVYCYDATCHLAAQAALALTQQGYRVIEVEGGWERWVDKGFRSEPSLQAA